MGRGCSAVTGSDCELIGGGFVTDRLCGRLGLVIVGASLEEELYD